MTKFYVYRSGYNAANNSAMHGGPETVRVRTVEANNEDDAVQVALDDGVTVYNNQHIWAEPTEEADARKAARGRVID